MFEFELPDVGEGVAEGELVAWHVAVGDHVEEDQVLADVETDKAVVDLPAPVAGTVERLHAEEGEVVPVGSVIVTIDADGDDTEVWRWSDGQMFAQAVRTETLAPGDSVTPSLAVGTSSDDALSTVTVTVSTDNESQSADVEVRPDADLIVSLGDVSGSVGDTVSVPVNITSVGGGSDDVESYSFGIEFDDSVLDFTEVVSDRNV